MMGSTACESRTRDLKSVYGHTYVKKLVAFMLMFQTSPNDAHLRRRKPTRYLCANATNTIYEELKVIYSLIAFSKRSIPFYPDYANFSVSGEAWRLICILMIV
jgi:hypothetical protein